MDYLTKWPEVFATPDQSALTIARLLVEHIISRHGVPNELLSDRGPAFISKLLKEVCILLGVRKTSTTAYHPQTDGLVGTLTDMLAKTVEKDGKDWDTQLPYVLFAYRSSPQESTSESPFFLLYGREPQLPTKKNITSEPLGRTLVNIANYREEVLRNMRMAWDLAKENIKKAQKKQKTNYDRHSREPTFGVGDRVFLHAPSARSGPAYKFSLPYKGPYRVVDMADNVASLQLIGQSESEAVRVAISRSRHCPKECLPQHSEEQPEHSEENAEVNLTPVNSETPIRSPSTPPELWTTCLRRRSKGTNNRMTRTSSHKDWEM
jgi:hypothetical protein